MNYSLKKIGSTLALLLFIISCSNSDDSTSIKTHFEPPLWIIGVWEEIMPINEGSAKTYEFTSNNFIDRAWPGSDRGLDYNESINNSFFRKIEERNLGATYEIDLFISGDIPTTFWKFKKISDTEISCWLKDGLVIAPVEFNLQKVY